jgi:hypothetical protein
MKIDRAKFLLLTSTLAAGGACATANQDAGQMGAIVSIPAASVPPPPPSAVPTASIDDGRPRHGPVLPEPDPGEDDEDDDDDESVASTFKLSPQPARCDNNVGTPGVCGALRAPGPTCESFADTKDACGKMKAGFRPRVAEKVVQCFLQASGTQNICDFQKPQKCALVGLQSVCIDPSTESKCRSIVAGCSSGRRRGSSLSMDLCQAALSAVTDKNKQKIAACMTEGCDAQYCFFDLK